MKEMIMLPVDELTQMMNAWATVVLESRAVGAPGFDIARSDATERCLDSLNVLLNKHGGLE